MAYRKQYQAQRKRYRQEKKRQAVEYLGGKCIKCGYNKCIGSMVFHHKDPTQKDFGIGKKGVSCAWETLKKELDKCELYCANCHNELHWDESNGSIAQLAEAAVSKAA